MEDWMGYGNKKIDTYAIRRSSGTAKKKGKIK